ncbi:MAG: TGS domain-containing protein [Chloroflexia bacterium]
MWELTGQSECTFATGRGRGRTARAGARSNDRRRSGGYTKVASSFRTAQVWGPSARFDGQQVGRDHLVLDGDTVEIVV